MELLQINEIDYTELRHQKFDYFIAACGYQPRCTYLAEKTDAVLAEKHLLIIDEPDPGENRSRNLQVFARLGFNMHHASVKESRNVEELVSKITGKPADHLNLLIDYSCMPKMWYSVLVDSITRNNFRAGKISLFLSYTPKKFDCVSSNPSVDYIGPILQNKDKLKDKRPVSMVISLDNKHQSIVEAIKQIRPANILAFIPECSHDPEYTKMVLQNNKALLERFGITRVIHYDARHPGIINSLLTTHCLDQRIESEVMIVPQGPKTFSMMAMLLSVRYPDIKLWEIIDRQKKPNADHGFAAAEPVVVKVTFADDEEDEFLN
ncbi:MAG TPA: hypothetical protein VJ203_14060 [Bacteroidales bacterium]|nr:hypothetical protein [Bacteroidales bacterium]